MTWDQALEQISRIGRQYARGVITHDEFRQEVAITLLDVKEYVDQTLRGALNA